MTEVCPHHRLHIGPQEAPHLTESAPQHLLAQASTPCHSRPAHTYVTSASKSAAATFYSAPVRRPTGACNLQTLTPCGAPQIRQSGTQAMSHSFRNPEKVKTIDERCSFDCLWQCTNLGKLSCWPHPTHSWPADGGSQACSAHKHTRKLFV